VRPRPLVASALAIALGASLLAATSGAQRASSGAERSRIAGVPAGAWSEGLIPEGWIVVATRSYQLQSRLDRERTVALGRHLEALLGLFRALIPVPTGPPPLVVKLFADEDEYRAYGHPAERFGRYDPGSGEVVAWNTRLVLGRSELAAAIRLDPDRAGSLTFAENQGVLHLADTATRAETPDLGAVLARCCWRQYLGQRVWPEGGPELPPWIERGLAEYFATATPDARGRYRTGPNEARIRDLRWLLLEDGVRPLAPLLRPEADTPAFDAGTGPAAEGWSLIEFLLASDEAGRRQLVPALLADLRRTGSFQRSAREVFADVDLERLQLDWQAWAGELECDDPLAELARSYGDRVRPDQLTGDVDIRRRYGWLWSRRHGPQPGDSP